MPRPRLVVNDANRRIFLDAKRCLAAREANGISFTEIASVMGVAPSTAANWLSGRHSILASDLPWLAMIMDVKVVDLVDDPRAVAGVVDREMPPRQTHG